MAHANSEWIVQVSIRAVYNLTFLCRFYHAQQSNTCTCSLQSVQVQFLFDEKGEGFEVGERIA